MKKNTKLLLTLSLLGTTLFACNSIPLVNQRAEVRQEEATNSFAITNESSSVATLVGLPTSGVAGEEYSFVVSLKPGYQFNDKLTIKCGEENVTYTVKDGKFTFTMPEGAVNIKLDTAATEFTIYSTSMFVDHVLLDSEDEEDQLVANVRSTLPGTKLKFELKSSINFYCTKVMVNGVEVKESEEDGYYHFTMPTRPVIISTDKIAKDYDVTVDQTALKLSTMKMYTDSETKEEITKAHKGQKVYFEFAYDVTKVDYKFTVEYEANGKDDDGTDFKKGTLNVTKVEGNDKLYSFDMVSSNVKVVITLENDCSKLVGHSLVNNWKLFEVDNYGTNSGDKVLTFNYNDESKNSDGTDTKVLFDDNGEGVLNAGYNTNKKITWDFDNEKATLKYDSNTRDVYFTEHLITFQYTNGWDDAYFGITSTDYDIHVFKFGKYRIAWLEDESKNILESLFLTETGVFANVTIKKQNGEVALGSDLTVDTENLEVYSGEKLVGTVNKAVGNVVNEFTVDKSEYLDIKFTSGESTDNKLNAKNGEKITMKISLKDNAPAGIKIITPTAKYLYFNSWYGTFSLSNLSLTAVTGSEYTYTFTMPSSEVYIYSYVSVANQEQDYAQLGTYKGFSPSSYSRQEEITSTSYEYTLAGDGLITKKSGSSQYTYSITSIENKAEGKVEFKDCENKNTFYYNDGIFVTNYSTSKNDLTSVIVGARMGENDKFVAYTHNKIDGESNSWAVTIYINGTFKGSLFCYKGELYTGVRFRYDEGSSRVSSTSSYYVYKNNELLFDVINDTITSHVE